MLIGTILAQRNTDASTNRAMRLLFGRYKTIKQIANAPIKELEKLVKSTVFYHVKARRIKEVSRIILKKHRGKVPKDFEALVSIPGIGRKTANIIMSYGFGIPSGIAVDTHVHRLSNRLGWVKTKTPEQTERQLLKIVPKKHWLELNELFVTHGKTICIARKPKCNICPIRKWCEYYRTIYKKN
jgi:endonuclease-3